MELLFPYCPGHYEIVSGLSLTNGALRDVYAPLAKDQGIDCGLVLRENEVSVVRVSLLRIIMFTSATNIVEGRIFRTISYMSFKPVVELALPNENCPQ